MIALLIIFCATWAAPAKCVHLPAGAEDLQVFIDADANAATGYGWGADYVVRCVVSELCDAWHCHIRSTVDSECGAVGGWGESAGLAELGATALAMPANLVPAGARLMLETYTVDGVRLTSGPVNAANCQSACGLGDFDGDCDVDLKDYALFQNSFGN